MLVGRGLLGADGHESSLIPDLKAWRIYVQYGSTAGGAPHVSCENTTDQGTRRGSSAAAGETQEGGPTDT